MTPKEVKDYFVNAYSFNKKTGMSHSTLINWINWGYIPIKSQIKLEILTGGKLKCGWINLDEGK